MADRTSCPSHQDLQRFVLGKLEETSIDHVQQHLSGCGHCLETLDSISATDYLTVAVHDQGPVSDRTPDADIENLVARLSNLGPCFRNPGGDDIELAGSANRSSDQDLGFLSPPESPGELGRIGGYRVLRIVGVGGMGIVFQAHDPDLNRLVALKVMKPSMSANESNRRRFLREAQATAALEHDHVVTIYRVAEERGIAYLAMPLLRGETLQDRITRQGILPARDVAKIGQEIASGLAAAHRIGLVHRDIKPANIWLEERPQILIDGGSAHECESLESAHPRVKLLDFGLVRAVDDDIHLTREGVVAGTPHYMAPEQAEGREVDHRSDLFSLGCVLYRLLTGRMPFPGETSLAVLRSLAVDQPVPPHEINRAVPPGLSAITMKLLSKQPAQRPQSAIAVAEALAKFGPETHSAKRVTGRWVAAAVVLFVLVAAVVKLTFKTPDGTLIVELTDPAIKVSLDAQDGLLITDAGPREIRLPPGSYRWQATKAGQPDKSDVLTIQQGLETVLRVTFEPDVSKPKPLASLRILDQLDASGIPVAERFARQPPELVRVLGEHRGRLWHRTNCVVFQPGGKLIASGGEHGAIKLWDAETLCEAFALIGHEHAVRSLAFTADGKLLLSGADDRSVRLWDVANKRQLLRLDHADAVLAVAVSRDGKRALSGSAESERPLRLWNLETRTELMTFGGHAGGVTSVALSQDGKLALSGGNDKTVRLWDLTSGQERHCFRGHTDRVLAVALSADAKRALSSGARDDPTVRVWDLESKSELHKLKGHTGNVHGLMLSSDGRRAASSCEGRSHQCIVWDVDKGTALHDIAALGWGMSLSQDETVFAAAAHGIRLWNMADGSERLPLTGHDGQVRSVIFTPDGSRVLTCSEWDAKIRCWDVQKGTEVRAFVGHTGGLHALALSPDGKHLLSGGQDLTGRVWDMESGQELLRIPSMSFINRVEFSTDGRQVLISGAEGARLWDLLEKRELRFFKTPDDLTWNASFVPGSGRIVAALQPDKLVQWDIASGVELRRETSPDSTNFGVIVAKDGTYAISGGYLGTIRVWDLVSAEPRHRTFLRWHTDRVLGLALSPDGQLLVTSGTDGRVIVWRTNSGDKLHEWQFPGMILGVTFAPDGRHLATANGNGTVYILRLPPLQPASQ